MLAGSSHAVAIMGTLMAAYMTGYKGAIPFAVTAALGMQILPLANGQAR